MLVPPALLLGASVISPIYTSRYVLMCIPALALLGGMAIVALGRVAGPVALVLVVLAGLTTQVTQRQPYGHYDNVRALDQIVAANARPGDVRPLHQPERGELRRRLPHRPGQAAEHPDQGSREPVRHARRNVGRISPR